ncbi:hypothetical protein [Limimaricola pyoseonensis]|uniref:Carbohydrate ABC transporter substrate-binding protein, CUT1 family n=1 Tax=Limimaricola pyoseonensis TaxID=521013 RepID=A0A1G7HRV7_9RHOB|nr:hypothetical protein [Limimaricola pyoseonensis]SDF03221.1 carbohydrate ABC transporter substrate-binding protein, CUT1 family [Limimaricola pyoseonensis]
MTYLGLTWDHPRGRNALIAAAAGTDAPEGRLLRWEVQPLEGFESAPIADLAARHDLLVMDHPHIGEAVAEDCLTPLEALFPEPLLARWRAQSIGPAMESYRWDGRSWALPLDVATQVTLRRPDRIADAPTSWDEMEEIAARLPVALSLAGPHAFLTLLSLAASEGALVGGEAMLPDGPALAALSRMARLWRSRPPGSETLNPIALSERMAGSDEIALVPLVFGYVNYARGARPLAFSDTPRAKGGYGGVLGGTGIAFTRRAAPSPALLDHIAWLMRPETQAGFIPAHDGQPSARGAWADPAVNAAWGGFYAATMDTAEHAALRPRFDGYIAFQTAAAAAIRDGLAGAEDEARTLDTIRRLWRDARGRARGALDDDRRDLK